MMARQQARANFPALVNEAVSAGSARLFMNRMRPFKGSKAS
jgi:hypothetical protein